MLSLMSSFGRDLDQLDAAAAPVALRLDPRRSAACSATRLEVLVVVEVAVALEQAEARRVRRLEGRSPGGARGLSSGRQSHSPVARLEQQAVGVVHLGTEVVEVPLRVLAVEEHARERRDAELLDVVAQEEPRLDVDARLLAGRHHEAVGAGDARAVEQRVDASSPCAVSAGRTSQNSRNHGNSSPDGSAVSIASPRAESAEHLVAADRAEVARAEEDDHLVAVLAAS